MVDLHHSETEGLLLVLHDERPQLLLKEDGGVKI